MIKYLSLLFICIFSSGVILIRNEYATDELIGKGNPVLYGTGYKLQKEAHKSFLLMQSMALKNGIQIEVVSSYRSFEHQKSIWNRKYDRFTSQGLSPELAIRKIIEYSTIPGTSRHHWGTDIDIIDANVIRPKSVLEAEHFVGEGVYVPLKKWLDAHASEFGFCLVYTDQVNRKGFKYEPWHYSYKPISKEMLVQYRKIDLRTLLKEHTLLGSDYFTEDFIEKYITENILDINPNLK